jgi:hypothetical protein
VLDVEPLFEDHQTPVFGPHLYVCVPALQFATKDFLADLLQDPLGIRRVLVVRNEIERRPHLIESHFGCVVVIDRPQPVAEWLLPRNSLGLFANTMQTYRERLGEAARELSAQYDAIKSEAQRRFGSLFNPADYPSTLNGLFDMEWSVVPIEPPQYLVALNPEVFQQEQARVRERFESAVELAEQAFATELQRLTAHLAERLTGLHDGQPKVFRDSAVENLREFFERFRRLNIRSSPELDELVQQAQQTINGIEPQTLRDSNRLRQMVARVFEQIQASVGELLVDRPRRNILRRGQTGAEA